MKAPPGERANVDEMGDSDTHAIGDRGPDHYHVVQQGTGGAGGVPVPNVGEITVTNQYTSSGTALVPGNIQDTPAYLVVGSYFIKFTL